MTLDTYGLWALHTPWFSLDTALHDIYTRLSTTYGFHDLYDTHIKVLSRRLFLQESESDSLATPQPICNYDDMQTV